MGFVEGLLEECFKIHDIIYSTSSGKIHQKLLQMFFFFFTTSRRSSTTTAAAAATDIDITVEPVTTDRVGLDVVTIQVH